MKDLHLQDLKRTALIILGSVIMALNVSTFIKSAGLYPGGLTGVALLVQNISLKFFNKSLPFSVLAYLLNAIPVYIGFKFIGKKFTIFSVIMILLSGILTDIFSQFNWAITNDMLLCSIFGGIINSVAIVLCLLADSSSGGTDFIAIFISEKTGKSAWGYIFVFNCIILAISGLLFGWDKALYSIIFQFASTESLEVLYKKYQKTTLLIITKKPDEVYEIILYLTNHTATVFEGKGEFSGENYSMLYSVVSSNESSKLEKAIKQKDPSAFINVIQSKEIVGRFFKHSVD